jgi:hypothetical protein
MPLMGGNGWGGGSARRFSWCCALHLGDITPFGGAASLYPTPRHPVARKPPNSSFWGAVDCPVPMRASVLPCQLQEHLVHGEPSLPWGRTPQQRVSS